MGEIARHVKGGVIVLGENILGIVKMVRVGDFDQALIGAFLTCPASGDDRPQAVFLARVAIDEACQGIALAVKLHHPQVVLPLVVDIHVAGELELGAIGQSGQLEQRVDLLDIGVDGVFGVSTGVVAAGGDNEAGHLGILGAHVGKDHRRRAACPRAHSTGHTVVAHIGQQVKI